MIDEVTPVILAGDEEANIERTLRRLSWAREVIICDSYSEDATLEIARRFPNVRVVQRRIDTLADQWTWAVSQASTPWVLTLDADYVLSDSAAAEIASLSPAADVGGYETSFIYAIGGRPLRASLYPPRNVLLRRDRSSFFMDGHTQRVRVEGRVGRLREKIVHDDRKPLSRLISRQRRYMRDEARKLRQADPKSLNAASRLRKWIFIAPLAMPFYTLFVKRLILDGWPGLYYAFERTVAEIILSIELLKRDGARSSDRP